MIFWNAIAVAFMLELSATAPIQQCEKETKTDKTIHGVQGNLEFVAQFQNILSRDECGERCCSSGKTVMELKKCF